MRKVTDPKLLEALNAGESNESSIPSIGQEQQQPMEMEMTQGQRPQQGGSIADMFKQALAQSMVRAMGGIGENITNQFIPESMKRTRSLARGYSHGIPEALYGGARGVSQLFGSDALPEIQGEDPQDIYESIGQGVGKGVGYGAMAAPIAAGAEGLAPAFIPELLTALTGAGAAGAALTPGDAMERTKGALEFMTPMAAFKGLAPVAKTLGKGIKGAVRGVTPEKTYTKIVDQYDKIKGGLEDVFDFVSKQAKERGVSKVEEIPDELFDNALNWGTKTKSFARTVAKAKTGDYDSVRKLYSRLGDIGRKASKANDWEKEEMMTELQDMINEGLQEHFGNVGHKDLAQWLGTARSGWAKMKNTFESPYENQIKKLVGENRDYPETLQPLMGNRKSLERLFKANPEVAADVQAKKDLEALMKAFETMKSYGKVGVGALIGSKLLPSHGRSYNEQ